MTIRAEGDRLVVEGSVTMHTVGALLETGRALCGDGQCAGTRSVDLSAVTAVDSAALALVLAWMRASRAAGRTLVLVGVPEPLRSLAALYDLGDLLPLGGAQA